jgi:hypothetical protein
MAGDAFSRLRRREHLNEAEVERLIKATQDNRYGRPKPAIRRLVCLCEQNRQRTDQTSPTDRQIGGRALHQRSIEGE